MPVQLQYFVSLWPLFEGGGTRPHFHRLRAILASTPRINPLGRSCVKFLRVAYVHPLYKLIMYCIFKLRYGLENCCSYCSATNEVYVLTGLVATRFIIVVWGHWLAGIYKRSHDFTLVFCNSTLFCTEEHQDWQIRVKCGCQSWKRIAREIRAFCAR